MFFDNGGMDAARLQAKAMDRLVHTTRLAESSDTPLNRQQLKTVPIGAE
jgi:hypothetical protein